MPPFLGVVVNSAGGAIPEPWADDYAIYVQTIGTSSHSAPGFSAGYNHLINDGVSTEYLFSGFMDTGSLCSPGYHLYYSERLDVNGSISATGVTGFCYGDSYFSDLTALVHSYAIDGDALYIARSNGPTVDVYRIDRSTNEFSMIYEKEFVGQQRALLIDVSNGNVLLHSYDRDDFADNEVVLITFQDVDVGLFYTTETLTLPGSGIPMHLQVLVAP